MMLAFMRSTFSLFGMTTSPRWTPQLMTTCAGDAPSRSAMPTTSGSVKNTGFPWPGSGRPAPVSMRDQTPSRSTDPAGNTP